MKLGPATNHISLLAYWCIAISFVFRRFGKPKGQTSDGHGHVFLPLQQIPTIKYRIHPIQTG